MDLIPRDNFFLGDIFNDFINYKDVDGFKCDIYEKDNNYYIEFDLPGYSKEDIKLECDNGYLTIVVSKKQDVDDSGKNYIRRERISKEFSRSFYLGDIDFDSIRASFKNGSLIIELPKQEQIDTKRTIEIED